jgi:hypothetical protein
MEGTMPDPAKLEQVRERLAKCFPTAQLRVRDPGRFRPVAFMLRWSPAREARVRVGWERFERYDSAEEILPAAAIEALDAGESVLVRGDGIEIESEDC